MIEPTLTEGRTVKSRGLADKQSELGREVSRVSNELGRFREARIEITDRGQSGVFESGGNYRISISVTDLMRALTPQIQKEINRILTYKDK